MRYNYVGDTFTFGVVLSFVTSHVMSDRIITVNLNLNLNNKSPSNNYFDAPK